MNADSPIAHAFKATQTRVRKPERGWPRPQQVEGPADSVAFSGRSQGWTLLRVRTPALLLALVTLSCSSAKPPKPMPVPVAVAERSASQAAKLSAAGNWQAAASQWQSALQEYRLLNDRLHEAIALHNLAEAREQLGDLKTAHQLLESAAEINSALKNDEQWWNNQMALLQVEAKSSSTELAERFEKLNSKQPPNRALKALFLNERGLWRSRSADFGAASADFKEALQLFAAEKNESGAATVVANQALLLERQGKYREAAEAWRLAENRFEGLANPIGIAVSMAGRGRTLLAAREQLPVAEDLLRRAARNFHALHDEAQAQQAIELLRKAQEAQGKNPTEAVEGL